MSHPPSPTAHPEHLAWDVRLRDAILEECGTEHETWALEQVERVMQRLNQARQPRPPLEAEVLGLRTATAFTVPGRYLYVSRRLQERCSDAQLAFVLAHEAAHHDLGHFHELETHLGEVPDLVPAAVMKVILRQLTSRTHRADHELAADSLAMEWVLKAGFPGDEALSAFDNIKAFLLDYGRVNEVYGPEDADSVGAVDEVERLFWKTTAWVSRKLASHPAIVDRETALREKLAGR